MKQLLEQELGKHGKLTLVVEEGQLKAKIEGSYPMMDLLAPVKTKFVDKLKGLIPGEWDDKLIDDAWAKAVASLTE